jgi:hypothetical protein
MLLARPTRQPPIVLAESATCATPSEVTLPACHPFRFQIYFARLVSPKVPAWRRPPPLDLRGLRRLWSWLTPVFSLSDGALLESAGLDALVAQRVLGFGVLAMLPLSILGVAV